jgi:hypothetical protein
MLESWEHKNMTSISAKWIPASPMYHLKIPQNKRIKNSLISQEKNCTPKITTTRTKLRSTDKNICPKILFSTHSADIELHKRHSTNDVNTL